MKEYAKFEKEIVMLYKRKLITFTEAWGRIYGYLKCLEDKGILDSERVTEEHNISMKKLLDSEK